MTTRARRLAAISTAVLAGTALTGCGLIGQLTGGPDIDFTTVQLHPTAEAGIWLSPGYAAGVASTWTAPGEACGAAEGIVAINDSDTGSIVGYDAASGTEVWRVADADCESGQVTAGDIYTARNTMEGIAQFVQVDIATGVEQVFYEAEIYIGNSTAIGRGESAVYIHADSSVGAALLAFAFDGTVTWQQPMDLAQDCYLVGDHILCHGMAGEMGSYSYTAIDAGSGEMTIPTTPIEAGKDIILTTGGFTFVTTGITMDVETTPIFDFNGNEIGTADDAALPYVRTTLLRDLVLYGVEDLTTEGANLIWMTDAEGRSVVHAEGAKHVFSATGTEMPMDEAYPVVAAADGSTVLTTAYLDRMNSLVSTDGTVLQEFGDVSITVVDGLITAFDYTTWQGTVYVPAG